MNSEMTTRQHPASNEEIKQLIDWVNKKKATNRKSSKNYYERNFKISETMSETEKQMIADKIKKRQEYFHQKYLDNKEVFKNRVKEARAKSKLQQQQSVADIVTQPSSDNTL